jgi:Clp amino terminal domain, pathogenicity island component/UvrB/uvrC motif
VVVLAQEEARALKHNYIGTEHILLGLLREEEGLAARVLESLEITVDRVRAQVVRIVGSGEEVTSGQIPFTPRATKVLELALREALSLHHNYIGTEHILLGLVRENGGVAARILLDFDVNNAEIIGDELIRMLSGPEGSEQARSMAVNVRAGRQPIDQAWLDGLGAVLDRLAAEIRDELKRAPDTADLLLVLAHAPDTLAAQTLRELGVNLDELTSKIEGVRAQASPAEKERAQRLLEVTRAKEQAIEEQRFESAAQLRDQERELRQQAEARTAVEHEVLQQIRRQLGIPSQTDDPPEQHSDQS